MRDVVSIIIFIFFKLSHLPLNQLHFFAFDETLNLDNKVGRGSYDLVACHGAYVSRWFKMSGYTVI